MKKCNLISNDECSLSISNDEIYLLRYVKPSYIINGDCSDAVLQLRDDRSPPEEYLSFHRGDGNNINSRIQNVISILNGKKFNYSKNGGFLHINTLEIEDNVNKPRKLVEVKVENDPHYGIYFCSNSPVDILEAKTTLLIISQFELIPKASCS